MCAILVAQPFAATSDTIKGITSNTIIRLASKGDTLWMVTDKGINRTSLTSDTLSFWGIKSSAFSWDGAAALAFGQGKAVVCQSTLAENVLNPIWTYSYATGSDVVTIPKFDAAGISRIRDTLPDSLKNEFSFLAIDAARWNGQTFIACGNGGLFRLESDLQGTGTIFLPGKKSNGTFPITEFPFDSTRLFFDPDLAVTSIAVPIRDPSTHIYISLSRVIWQFTPSDTGWKLLDTTLGSPALRIGAVRSIYVRDSATIFGAFSVHTTTDTTTSDSLYRYNTSLKKWLAVQSGHPKNLVFGTGDTAYLSGPRGIIAFNLSDIQSPLINEGIFGARIAAADQSIDLPTINDMIYSCSPKDTTCAFILATSKGLYFSRNERKAEALQTPFIRAFRSLPIALGLRKAYFFPSILSVREPKGLFAYSLEKPAKVTIKIFDWNMDAVKTIIKDRPRLAGNGAQSGSGRSNIEREDFWDGTSNSGRRCVPGVYTFHITASTGESSFGKIIIAK